MKQLLIFFIALTLFSACKNNSLKPGEVIGGGLGQPDPNNPNKNRWANNPNNPNPGGLPSDLHNKLVAGCLQQVGNNDPQAQQKCDCWVGKVEARFPNAKSAQEIPENVADELAVECMKNFGGNVPNNPNDPNNPNNPENPYNPNTPDPNTPAINGGGGNWTAQQRQQYIQGCATTAQQSGLTVPQANSYCDCMTRKVEMKFTFEQAARLTAADFQTQEWQQAGYDCYPKQQQYEY
jgi:hypothetical protein